ncbi:MAG: hypothetical protein RLZ98_2551 [Pseudomonadota bacterium]|jgi:hypothetical protein
MLFRTLPMAFFIWTIVTLAAAAQERPATPVTSIAAPPQSGTAAVATVIPPVPVPATRVSMRIPEGFVPAVDFTGFKNEKLSASIQVTERPASEYQRLEASLSETSLNAQGITQPARGSLDRPDSHVYVHARQALLNGTVFARYFLLFRDTNSAALIAVNIPVVALEKGEIRKSEIENALASATLGATRAIAAITAKFGYTGPFEEVADGSPDTRVYRRTIEPEGYLLVSSSAVRAQIATPISFAGPLLQRSRNVSQLEILNVGQGIVGATKRKALVHVARGVSKSGRKMAIRQWFITGENGGYSRILLVIPAEEARALAPEIDKIIASFED